MVNLLITQKIKAICVCESVFTKEDLSKIPNMADAETPVPNIPPIIFIQSGIQHLLSTLDVNKASGPDRISPYIKTLCRRTITSVTSNFYAIFSYRYSTIRLAIRKHMSSL